jgi:hypothetical protein
MGKLGLLLNFVLGISKIVGSVSSLLFSVDVDLGVTDIVTGWVVCTTIAIESGISTSNMVCTSFPLLKVITLVFSLGLISV